MIGKLLLPRQCKWIGVALFPLAVILLIAVYNYDYSVPFLHYHMNRIKSPVNGNEDFLFASNFGADLSGEVALLLTFGALFMIAFSAERHEDEYVSAVRLRALQVSVYANYIILAISSIFIYSFSFLVVMELNLFTILILFILVFNFDIHIKPRFSKSVGA